MIETVTTLLHNPWVITGAALIALAGIATAGFIWFGNRKLDELDSSVPGTTADTMPDSLMFGEGDLGAV